MSGLFIQLKAFSLTLILGLLAGGIFHYYQLSIRKARIGKYLLYIIDLILWIFMLLLVFAAMLFINQGEMRFYVLIALLGGILIYYLYFSSSLNRTQSKLAEGTVKIFALLGRESRKPFIGAVKLIKNMLKKRIDTTPPADQE